MAGVNVDNVGLTYLHILDGVTETLNQKSKVRNLVKQNYDWRGSHLEHKLLTARNHAIGFREDGGTLPVADKQDYVSMKVGRKIVSGSISITDAAMATASKAFEVARDVVASETEGMMAGILKFENFFYTRDGTGVVGTVKTGTTGTTLLTDDARALWDGGTYQVYDSTLTTNRGNLVISKTAQARTAAGYSSSTTVSTVPSGTTNGDKLVWDGALNIAYTGLDALVDDAATTFQSVNVSTYPRWSSFVNDNSGTLRDLEPHLFRSTLAAIGHKTGSDTPSQGLTCIGTFYQLANLDELYEASVRLSPSDKVSGVETPTFQSSLGKVTLVADSDAPYNKIFLVDFSQIYRGVQKKLGWRVENGQIFKRSDLALYWTATALEIAELYIKERNSSAKIEDLRETISVAY